MQRLDLFIADEIVVKIKVVPKLQRIHKAQRYSYLKTVGKIVGFVFNFGSSEPEFVRLYFDVKKVESEWLPQEVPLPEDLDLVYPNRLIKSSTLLLKFIMG